MTLDRKAETDLKRHGCAMGGVPGRLYVDWPWNQLADGSSPQIRIRLLPWEHEGTVLLCLAIEVSSLPLRPHYVFCPFDLRSKPHRAFLKSLVETGNLEFAPAEETKGGRHQLRLSSLQRQTLGGIVGKVLSQTGTSEFSEIAFDAAVSNFEQNARLSDYFPPPHLMTQFQKSFDELLADSARSFPQLDATGMREHLRALCEYVNDVAYDAKLLQGAPIGPLGHLLPYWTAFFRERASTEPIAPTTGDAAPQLPSEAEAMQMMFQGVEATFSLYAAILALISLMESQDPEQRKERLKRFGTLVSDFVSRQTSGKGMSLAFVQHALEELGITIHGKPGRLPVDYSWEYERKAEGHSWSKVARLSFERRADLLREFGTREYNKLTFEEKEALTKRTQEGVKSWAQRFEKPYPIPRQTGGEPSPPENP